MSITVDCGEGKHLICSGSGRTSYLFPQDNRSASEPAFSCGCVCHHGGIGPDRIKGVPCADCEVPS